MLSFKLLKTITVFGLGLLVSFSSYSQNDDVELSKNLEEQYESLMKKSTTYQDYKVIKVVGINQLWENVNDSINLFLSNYYNAKNEIKSLNNELKATQDSLIQTSADLEESNFSRDRISFLGIPLLKLTYNTIVWGIIFILAAIVVILFLRFVKSNSITKSTKKDYSKLEEEFESYKKNSRENEINLKRDLQTAVNTIEDLKK